MFIGKRLCWSLLLIKLQAWKPVTLLIRDFNTGVFLWALQNFYEQLFLEHLRWLGSEYASAVIYDGRWRKPRVCISYFYNTVAGRNFKKIVILMILSFLIVDYNCYNLLLYFYWLSLLHNFTLQSLLRFCASSNPAHCVLEIWDVDSLWHWYRLAVRLNAIFDNQPFSKSNSKIQFIISWFLGC